MKKLAIIMAVTAFVTFAFTGCGSKNDSTSGQPQILNDVSIEPATLDPSLSASIDAANIETQLFEGLFYKNLNGTPELGVAESCKKSSDNAVYTFILRKDAKWSDGKPITAQDFEYAWKRVIAPESKAEDAYMMYFVKNAQAINDGKMDVNSLGVKAVNASTLEVTLEKPNASFTEILTNHVYFPVRKDSVDKLPLAWSSNEQLLIGNGPFKIAKWTKGVSIEAVKNSNYWNAKNIKLDKIITHFIDGGNSQWANFESGKIDLGYQLPVDKDVQQLLNEKKVVVDNYLSDSYYYFNTSKKPFNDAKVRKAINLAIDRKNIVDNITKEGEKPAVGFVPYGMPDKSAKNDFRTVGGELLPAQTTPENITLSKQLLAEAGYSNTANFPEVKLLISDNVRNNKIAEAIKNDLATNLGITVTIQALQSKQFSEERKNMNYDIVRGSFVGDYVDAGNFLDIFTSTNPSNKTGWQSSEYDSLIEQANSAPNNSTRIDLLHKAEKMVIDDAVVVPIYFGSNLYYIKPYVKHFYTSPLGLKNLRSVYIAKH